MKTAETATSIRNIVTAILGYGVALLLYFQLKNAGILIPAWIFHLLGITLVLSVTVSRIAYQNTDSMSGKPIFIIQRISTRIITIMTSIWVGLIFPAEASYIISGMFCRSGSDGQRRFILISTIIIGIIGFCIYNFGISKILGQQKTLKKFMHILKTPELCTEESFPVAEKYIEEFPTSSMQEYSKLLLCALYEKANRPELALQMHLTVSPSALGSMMPLDFFHCDRLYYYLINGKIDEAKQFFNSYYNELYQLYREKQHPGVLHTFAMFYRSVGEIDIARKILNEALQKKLPEKSMIFAVTAENALCCIAEGNIRSAAEALEHARTLAEFPNEKTMLTKLEEAVSAAKI